MTAGTLSAVLYDGGKDQTPRKTKAVVNLAKSASQREKRGI